MTSPRLAPRPTSGRAPFRRCRRRTSRPTCDAAISPSTRSRSGSDGRGGGFVAAPGALADLESETLRILHPESFRDDPTRLLRLARYVGRLGFGIAPETFAQAERDRRGALDTVSAERIGAELRLLADEADPVSAFVAVSALGLDTAARAGFRACRPRCRPACARSAAGDARPSVVVLAAATLGMRAEDREAMLASWAFPASQRETILAAGRDAPELVTALAAAGSPSQIAATVRGADPETIALAAGLAGRQTSAAGRRGQCRASVAG